jgi:Na+-transporting NADH:ubiquinone oxidoreductase subunit A
MTHIITKGLNLPITGEPVQAILPGPTIKQVGMIADDYLGMKPTFRVGDGDVVKAGQILFEDKKNPRVMYVSPAAGRISAIHRGAKRRFISLSIDVESDESIEFPSFDSLNAVNRETAESLLLESGLWTSFRTRPYSKAPRPGSVPHSIFVTAMDTNPLSAEPELIVSNNSEHFVAGLTIVATLTSGKVYVCTRNDSRIPGGKIPKVQMEEFHGPHPAGLAGTHIHLLDPVGPTKTVWHIGYQDVIAIGCLFTTGRLMCERVVAVAGPAVKKPGLYRTRLGARLEELTAGLTVGSSLRVVSGSVLCGREMEPLTNYLGRFHLQVSVLAEGNQREFLGWQRPGFNKFSVTRIYAGAIGAGKKFALNTNLNGGHRSMVPVETYERIMPLDILPTQLLRALIVKDTDAAQALGCLELDEEDLGLCTYVCPGKYEYGSLLRENLAIIEKEG